MIYAGSFKWILENGVLDFGFLSFCFSNEMVDIIVVAFCFFHFVNAIFFCIYLYANLHNTFI